MKGQLLRYASFSLLLVTLAGLLAACGGAANTSAPVERTVVVEATVIVERTVEVPREVVVTPTPAPRPEGTKTVLRVGTGDSGEGLTPHQTIIEQFEKENPDIQVQLEPVGSGDYYARILTQIAAGDPPDILQIGDDAVPNFVGKGAFVDLAPFITSGTYPLDTSIYLPGVLEPGQWEGKQYLLPKDFSPLAVYYNKKLFDQYKVPYPEDGWTWDDFLKTAQSLTKDTNGDGKTDVWGVQLPGPWTTGFEYWVAAAGGRLISEDGSTFEGYLDSPETATAVQFYSDLYNKQKVAPPPADLNAFGGGNSEFESGTAAMRLFGRWPQSGLKDNPNVDLGVVGPPAGAERANVLFWGGFGISALSENQEAAWRFLSYYVGAQGAEVWKDWALPTVASVAEASGQASDPIEGAWLGELNYLVPRAYVSTPYWGATADPALRKVLEQVIIDPATDVPAALKAAAQEAQQALADQQ
ncbi:MAG: sugar ABC transporter substrate-binding protein [Chloroflexales bacterium]|nr:sugar ABC transporter substrate-binding protein [Chloroflexales bacterium]